MRHVDGAQSSGKAVEIGGKNKSEDWETLFETCLNRFEKKGLSLKRGAKLIGIDIKTLYELEKAALGQKFSLGLQSVYRIKKFVLNGKRGGRRVKGVMQYPGKCVPFV